MGLFDWLKPKPAQTKTWKVGDRVLARWADSFFYPGMIRAVSGDSFQVAFDDGDVALVKAAHILRPDVKVGSRVFGRLQGGPAFFPGVVNQAKGETLQIRYDHGAEEWTTLSMVRIQHGPSIVGQEELSQPSTGPIPTKETLDLGEPTEEGDWRSGDRVLARWLDFYWYPGSILGMGTKGFHILYDDGDQRVVQLSSIMPLTVDEGEQIFIRPKNEPQRIYQPAVALRVEGETLDVEYEDGHRENNMRLSRARIWRCPVGIPSFPFEEGDRVLAYDCDDFLYPADLISIQEDKVIVQYLDGLEKMLTPELVVKFDLRVGSKIECRWKGGPHYFPGVIGKMEGDRIYIKYDDGDQEWTSIRLVRAPRRMPRG